MNAWQDREQVIGAALAVAMPCILDGGVTAEDNEALLAFDNVAVE